jgi:lipopolysaccharide transport system permease protein
MMLLGFNKNDCRFLVNMFRMGLADRYLGSALGGAWAFFNPLIMFALFTFVFGFVFKARLPGADSTLEYSIWLICGYGPWLANVEAITAASQSIIGNAGMIKNHSFKTETLPLSATLQGLIPLAVTIVFLLILTLVNKGSLTFQVMWLPLVVLVQFILLACIGLLVSVITTFIRDFAFVLPNLLMMLLFGTPIFYSVDAMPKIVQVVSSINPFYIISESYRAVLLWGKAPDLAPLIILGVISMFLLVAFLTGFRRVKGYFASIV